MSPEGYFRGDCHSLGGETDPRCPPNSRTSGSARSASPRPCPTPGAHLPRRTVVYGGLPGVLNLHHPEFGRFFDSSPSSGASLRLDGHSCPFRWLDIDSGLGDAPAAWRPAGRLRCSIAAPSSRTCRCRAASRTTDTRSRAAGQGHEGRPPSLPALQKAGRRGKRKLPLKSFRLFAELVRSPKGSLRASLSSYLPSIPEGCQPVNRTSGFRRYPVPDPLGHEPSLV